MKGYIILKGGDVEVSGAPEIISVLPIGPSSVQRGFDVDEEAPADEGTSQRCGASTCN
jgi:hypothetical protein